MTVNTARPGRTSSMQLRPPMSSGIELEAVNFAKEYKARVFSIFLEEYQAGRTPNPDILCNSEIKFKSFLDYALKMGAEKLPRATTLESEKIHGLFELLKGVDPAKDQSYFPHRLNQHQLSKSLFPIGGYCKTEIRKIAAEIGLPNARKKTARGSVLSERGPFREVFFTVI